ncbi:hypothetical protein [Azospirillum sp. TSO22-1]|uniref:hypothetical protein n=1 Tax=Azospirillum sp. TSO22-1 TaxID=716789 RepID=UPI0011B705B7|nr:hypothetical protein [Azospirillum sp. TSO22-1]
MSLGTVATFGGTFTLPTTSDTPTGTGLVTSMGSPRRGILQVTRTSAVVAQATVLGGTQTVYCGSTPVQMTVITNDSACATPSATACVIYVGVTVTVPVSVPSGSCATPTFTIQVDFF